ncbi:glycosyltransferase [Halorhodospira sp. 9622]|nr:glycosyltransferase [Halorhodospira sp. 9622]
MTKTKRTIDVLRAFTILQKHKPDAYLRIFGDGPEKALLQDYINTNELSKNVELVGWASHETILSNLEEASLLLSLSQATGERLPNIVKEAFASSCPAIVGKTPCIDELVVNGRNGYVLRPGDVHGAAERALTILSDPQLWDQMSACAHATVSRHFDIKETSRQRLRLWQ